MTAQKGSDLLLGLGDGGSPSTYTNIGGLRTKTVSFNGEIVDITNSDDRDKWRRLLAGAGIKTCSVSGGGVFKDDATDATMRSNFFAGVHQDLQIIIPDFVTIEGEFQISAIEYASDHNAEVTFTVTLESAGPLYVTA